MSNIVSPKIVAIIPARYGSTRFPGKPLAQIRGKSLIQRSYENAKRCTLIEEIIVATDDIRIFEHVKSFGGQALMTPDCPTGTDRVKNAIETQPRFQNTEFVLNIQGDEPCVDPKNLEILIRELEASDAPMATLATPFQEARDRLNRNAVKCVIDSNGKALYFSRAPIPGYRHLGLYAFRRDFLIRYAELPMTKLQKEEDLEQLKVLEHGHPIRVAIVNEESIGVDTPEDMKKVESWLDKQSSYSLPVGSHPL